MTLAITFHGAARNVTGSRYLVEAGNSKALVDCGLYQERHLRERNWDPFPIPARDLDAVLLTHAHLDHCGLLPKLVREGFSGSVHCTPASADIARIVLLDAAHIQEEDAKYKQRRHRKERRTAPRPVVPLYTTNDANAALRQLAPAPYGKPIEIAPGIEATFREAGHILGASSVCLALSDGTTARSVRFSGDVGRWDAPILRDPIQAGNTDYVVVESTYGNRHHRANDTIPDRLAEIINRTCKANGSVVIPSFAVERAQDLLSYLSHLLHDGRIPSLPVFIDSPMAIRVTEVFRHHPEMFDEEARELLENGKHPCDFPGLTMCRTARESKAINRLRTPAIIIAGSGMCTGGRIKHHLVHHISRPESTVMFVGYQARGTLGRYLLEGPREVRIHGRMHPVEAQITKINGFSAHADQDELIHWLSGMTSPPRHVFVTHGEPDAAEALAAVIVRKKGWKTSVPSYKDRVVLD
ncbi:MAG: MBL fold metallo-hydrolase [Lentisphaerae bacterium]|jgi:metallo-beta-lactamase family protein|nr:MBL fold metallo-hydrolase [Lentisphaerota bacterium]MBT5608864.1 MBL fold metallo-hydrolase [Lentisphaerota bacterium]MBT7057010.1 MBL fold metallo-hydrolase [Lentisphaerota bacterium]MBT7848482.1 MBL fold metallo-hydrolase [Lentisphaerota bacterium]